MTIDAQIQAHLASLPEAKGAELATLHGLMLELLPGARRWFLDGRDATGKVVANPSIGYGERTQVYADGSRRVFYQVGLSATSTGISVYLLGLASKDDLARRFGAALGKAKVTGYCISFRRLSDLHLETLQAAVRYAVAQTGG